MQAIQVPVTVVGLEQGVQAAMKKIGTTQINMSGAAKQINSLSQPLGRITGQADEFSKSMAAANARVLAFGASAGILTGVSTALKGIVTSTIAVEKSLANINTVLGASSSELEKFGNKIFDVAKNTGQSFETVAEGALELSRQGLGAAETLRRLNDALILSRLSGLDATKSVEGLTAAYNSFKNTGISTADILNKLVIVSQKYAVSEKDLIEGIKRSASVADIAGVSFDELVGIITAVQEKTARGGAVIGNSIKTIFARIQNKEVLNDLENLGVAVTDSSKEILPATKILQNLSKEFGGLSKIQKTDLAKQLGGIYQLDKLLASLEDMADAQSVYGDATKLSSKAADEAYKKNIALNQTLDSMINKVSINVEKLGNQLGEIGVTDNLKNVLSFFNNLLEGIQNLLGEESGLGNFLRGFVKGIGDIVSGPGLVLFFGIIIKLSKDLAKFGFESLKSFFNIGKSAKEIKELEKAIYVTLSNNASLQKEMLRNDIDRHEKLKLISQELMQQEALIRSVSKISSDIAKIGYKAGLRGSDQGIRVNPTNAAGGYMPAIAKESKNIKQGVGGARSGDKPVVIPNFNFGGGKKDSIVAHTGEYIVPNFGGGSGSAIFNRDMVQKMGLPSGARKINAAGGFIPNFAEKYNKARTLEEARSYWKKAKKETAMAAFENPNTSENDLIAAAESLAKGKNMSYKFDASKLKINERFGIGLVSLQNTVDSEEGMGRLTSDSPEIQKALKEIGVPDLGEILETRFRERNIDPKLFQGVKADLLQSKPNIAFNKIKIGSVNNLKKQFSSDTFKDFQQTVNRLFARPIADLGNELFGSVLGSIPSENIEDKYLFGKDVLGAIFESATQFYIKGADGLPSFQDGEGSRNQAFDFSMSNPEEAKRLNDLFFKGKGVGIAEAKLTANASTLNSIVSKSLNDQRVKKAMQKQIAEESEISMARGFIPNFYSTGKIPEKILMGRGFEAEVFDRLGLDRPGNRILDFPEGMLNAENLQENRFEMGIQGDFGDVKLTSAKTNKYNFLGKLIKHYDKRYNLVDYIIKAFKSRGQKNVSLNKKVPEIENATMFYEGRPNVFYPEEVSATLGQILHESRAFDGVKSPVLEAFSKARKNPGDPSSVALHDAFKRKKITAKINMDGISSNPDLLDKGSLLDPRAGIDENNPFALGYIPNFVNPLKEAVNREMAAGVPASQIYIDKNPSLKNAMNPMGLMVANRRDEPAGGFQGINRAKKEGADPMFYGAANGLIPNFANRKKYPSPKKQTNNPNQLSLPGFGPNQSTASANTALNNLTTAANNAAASVDDIGEKVPKTMSDFVGKLFLIQTVFTGISGALSEFGDEAQKWGDALAAAGAGWISYRELGDMKKLSKQEYEKSLDGRKIVDDFRKNPQNVDAKNALMEAINSDTSGTTGWGAKSLASWASKGGRVGSIASKALSVVTKIGPIFGRFIPIIGQVVTGFQVLNQITKSFFKLDLAKEIGDGFVKLAQSIGLMDTELQKLTKSLAKESKEIASNISKGKFEKTESPLDNMLTKALESANKKAYEKRLGDSFNKETYATDFASKTFKDISFKANLSEYATRAGMSESDLQEQYKTGKRKGNFFSVKDQILQGGVIFKDGRVSEEGGNINYKGVSNAQKELIDSLTIEMSNQFSSEEARKDIEKAVARGADPKEMEALYQALYDSAIKKIKTVGKSSALDKLKEKLLDIGKLDDPKKLAEALKLKKEFSKETQKEIEVSKQLDLIDLQTAQQKLDSLIKYKTALMDLPRFQDNSLSIEKEILNTTDARKISIDRELTARKEALNLAKEQSDAAYSFLKDQGAITAILEKEGLGQVTKQSFAELSVILEQVTEQIRSQGGYTEAVASQTENILSSNLKNKRAATAIAAQLSDQLNALKNQQNIQSVIQDLELKRNAIIEARNFFVNSQRSLMLEEIDMQKESISLAERLEEIEGRSFRTRAEALKAVAPKSMQFDIESMQNRRDRASAELKLNNQQNSIFRDLQKDLLGQAFDKKLGEDLVGEIKNAKGLKDLENIGGKFAEAEKKAAIEKLDAAFNERRLTLETAGSFNQIITDSASQFAAQLKAILPQSTNLVDSFTGSLTKPSLVKTNPIQSAVMSLNTEWSEQRKAIESSKAYSAESFKISQALNASNLAAKDFLATLEELDFSLRAAAIKVEENFDKLLLSFSNKIAREQRANIALEGRIERLGMTRDFELENRSNYAGIRDPQAYLQQQQSIASDYFQKIQQLELEKANKEIEIQFKTEQMNLENIKQLSINTEALKKLKEELEKDKLLNTVPNQNQQTSAQPKNLFEYYQSGRTSNSFGSFGSSVRFGQSSNASSLYADVYSSDPMKRIEDIENAAKAIAEKGGDFTQSSLEAAKKLNIAGYTLDQVAQLISEQANKYAANAEQSKQQEKSFNLSQEYDKARSEAGTFSEGLDQSFLEINRERANFKYELGVEIPRLFSDGMANAMMSALEGAESLKDVLRSAAYELVKTINQRMFSQFANSVVGGFGIMSSEKFASGGKVTGGSGTKDDVPAMLMGGEYVINKKAVAKYGPQFLEALNNGTLNGYAQGGRVQRGPQGNFYTPGTFGTGSIQGKRNLLDFATQTGTSGKFDQMVNESGFQAIRLEPESNRLSFSGMRNSPMFEVTQSAKQQAFDLYLQQYNAEQEARRQSKAQKKALTNQLLMLAGSAALGGLGKVAMTGGKAALGSLGSNATFGQKVMAVFKGAWSGGNVAGTNQMAGGLKNLFSGNFSTAFRSGAALKAIGIDEGLPIKQIKRKVSSLTNIAPLPEIITPSGMSDEDLGILFSGIVETTPKRIEPVPQRATGGMIPPTSGIDTVPAMLSGGEFIMNRAAVQNIGAGNLRSMNSGASSVTSEETSKDLNAQLIAKLDELIQVSGSSGDININVSSSGDSREQSSTQDGSSQRQQLARQIRDAVLQVIQEEKRIGGTLRR